MRRTPFAPSLEPTWTPNDVTPAAVLESSQSALKNLRIKIFLRTRFGQIHAPVCEARRTQSRRAVVRLTLLRAHAATASLAVRRMVDPGRGMRSLMRLLDSIAKNPADVTRASFVERWPSEFRVVAERRFTRMAGRGPHLTKKTVLADQAYLRDRTRKIVDYAHAYIAHRGPNPPPAPSFRDLRLATEAVIRVNNKYAQLLGEREAQMPTIIDAWESIFYEPWLTKRRRGIQAIRAPMVARGQSKSVPRTREKAVSS